MAFWGVEVKPGKPYTHRFDSKRGGLHLSQASLGTCSSNKKSILQCNVGDKKPIYLCSLLPERFETCPLNHEFEEEDEVIFSVIGPSSIHLSGFFHGETQDLDEDDYDSDSYGEDIAESDSDESSDYDTEDEYEDDFIDDDLDMYPPSHVPNSGVVIEEILDDEKPANENGVSKRGKKKHQSRTSDEKGNSERQIVVKSGTAGSILDSEDEDGFPVPSSQKNKADSPSNEGKAEENKDERTNVEAKKKKESLKRKAADIVENDEQTRETGQHFNSSLENTDVVPETDVKQKKEKKKKKLKGKEKKTSEADTGNRSNNQSEAANMDTEQALKVGEESDQKLTTEINHDINADSIAEGKRKKKKKKSKKQGTKADANEVQTVIDKNESLSIKNTEGEKEAKPFQVRSFPNGLVIEELAMGKPDGKKASPGKKVSVHYIGKLKKNGAIFDSNIGRAPFKFRLGVGQVIKGWDVGVNGMRVGDKRRLTIPPAMGYGAQGAGKAIPPNSWLVFDVELIDVR